MQRDGPPDLQFGWWAARKQALRVLSLQGAQLTLSSRTN